MPSISLKLTKLSPSKIEISEEETLLIIKDPDKIGLKLKLSC
ncbi:hypothetical protein OTSSIDO_0499 [Orientia tsutsugamushi str. Sido]|nr:hypothetical protein OTSSIDO_0499 [Orientia tsutsugamushi str. Sido]